jgi:hypothetical protein
VGWAECGRAERGRTGWCVVGRCEASELERGGGAERGGAGRTCPSDISDMQLMIEGVHIHTGCIDIFKKLEVNHVSAQKFRGLARWTPVIFDSHQICAC